MPFISVVIPCYNSAEYIKKCLDSLDTQDFKDFDVILVNDCSTDDTESVIKNYKESHSLDLIYHLNETNLGPGGSRNLAISKSESEYIAFCDSDDWYEHDYLSLMAAEAKSKDCDIVFCNAQKVLSNGKTIPMSMIRGTTENSVAYALSLGADSLCTLMVKRKIIDQTPQPNLKNGEDMAVIPLMIMKSHSFGYVDKYVYNYFCRSGSLSLAANEKVVNSLQRSFNYICENQVPGYEEEIEFIGVKNVVYGALLTHFKYTYGRRTAKEILRTFENTYPNWHKNVKIKSLPSYKRLFLFCAKRRWIFAMYLMAKLHALLIH